MALDKNFDTLVTHMTFIALISVHPDREAQIAFLFTEKAKMSDKYSDFVNVFLEEKALMLPEWTKFNQYVIELEEGKQPPYQLIYSLGLVELEILKTYIKTHLKTRFIRSSESHISAPILFDKKPDGSLHLCVDYWSLNNLTIQYQYLLPFIDEWLDHLGQAKSFTQLDLISAYYCIRIKKIDKWKTVFQSRYSHFKYQVMSFALSNALASFQSYIK